MQNNSVNIKLLVNAQAPADDESSFACNKPAIQALIKHFYKREELARYFNYHTAYNIIRKKYIKHYSFIDWPNRTLMPY